LRAKEKFALLLASNRKSKKLAIELLAPHVREKNEKTPLKLRGTATETNGGRSQFELRRCC